MGINAPPNVLKIFESWGKQPGYPILLVKVTKNTIVIKQERFLLRNPNNSPPQNLVWTIPITWITDKIETTKKYSTFWLQDRVETINVSYEKPSWLLINSRSKGNY